MELNGQQLSLVDEAYETKMAAFESDCYDGKGEAVACHQTGEFYSVVKEDRERAANIYERNCREKGYSASCFNLGKLHLAGKGVKQNDTVAESFFAKACKGGHLSGCYHQGLLMYLSEQSKQQAANKKPAADSSSSSSSSTTTPPSPTPPTPPPKIKLTWRQHDALKLLEKSCHAGEHDSCYFVGSHYLDPLLTDRNPKRSVAMLEKSCAGNHAPSCFNLAVLYKKGDVGVPPSEELFKRYKERTTELVKIYGSIGGQKTA